MQEMPNFFYNILIFPLVQILEFFYQFVFEIANKEGIAVIALSLIVTLCCLPLYIVAERWQEIQRRTEAALRGGVERIKVCFKGDEQYMILSTFYRQHHYHPMMALRSSFSLLIQVPFFIAAYHFLSGLGSLRGVPFLFIRDMGSPDALFSLFGFSVNVLPIAMTLINCVSGAIYSRGHPAREKVQIYAMAAVFLVLLYNSPAGLVLYWTMNNALSLVKNVFYKMKNPLKVLYVCLCVFCALCLLSSFTVLRNVEKFFRVVVFAFGMVMPFVPFAVQKLSKVMDGHLSTLDKNVKLRFSIFFFSALLLALLCGLAIPTTIIESEVENYCFVDGIRSPFAFVSVVIAQAVGFFVLWPTVFYAFFSAKVKKVITFFFSALALCALVNCFAFGGEYGPIYPELIFMEQQNFFPTAPEFIVNSMLIIFCFCGVFWVLEKMPSAMKFLLFVPFVSLAIVSAVNCGKINSAYSKMPPPDFESEIEPVLHLSRTGKNAIILMQDGCYSPFIPYVFEECGGLSKEFDGFKWYPNAVSMGRLTMPGISGIFGGYDFTPFQINLDEEKTLQTKFNEALLTLPLLFSESGWRVQVSDLPYENFLEYPTSDMYIANPDLAQWGGVEVESHDDPNKNNWEFKYKNHNTIAHNNLEKVYADRWYARHGVQKDPYVSTQIFRNFILFAFFKIAPPILRRGIYHCEYWLSFNKYEDSSRFIDCYSVHDYLPELTDFYDGGMNGEVAKGTLLMICNYATHEPSFLQAPEYEYAKKVTNRGNSPFKDDIAFSTMCGVFRRFSEFLDYLKKNDAYDNTRIIIVSDHGLHKDAGKLLENAPNFPMQKGRSMVTLMVKDFDSHGEFVCARMSEENFSNGIFGNEIDMTFMTNADTPYLATKDLIPDAKNPFTGNALKVENKNDYAIISSARAQSTRIRHEKKYAVRDDEWYTVRDNIFVNENWQSLYPDKK